MHYELLARPDDNPLDTLLPRYAPAVPGWVTGDIRAMYPGLCVPETSHGFVVKDPADADAAHLRIPAPEGRWQVTVSLEPVQKGGSGTISLWSGRRQCQCSNLTIHSPVTLRFAVVLCPVIPRGKTLPEPCDAIDLTFFHEDVRLSGVSVASAPETPVLWIAGDSTVTDQPADLPYDPFRTYCGWGQMLPRFLNAGAAVSNHAHSGLTTDSFRREGHWAVVLERIRPGDWVLFQFGHNDQKRPELSAQGGYRRNLEAYTSEVRSCGGTPVLVTPVSRTLWTGPGGTFNDLLAEHAQSVRQTAATLKVPLADLHTHSCAWIQSLGPVQSLRYFFPGDWTHHNDFGGFLMAGEVARDLAFVDGIREYLKPPLPDSASDRLLNGWQAPDSDAVASEAEHWRRSNAWASDVAARQHRADQLMAGCFTGAVPVSRAEALKQLAEALLIQPNAVYLDVAPDVFGDEWYAGYLQGAFDAGLGDALCPDGRFSPLEPISMETLAAWLESAG